MFIVASLEEHNGLDLLETSEILFFENQALFEGTSTATIREHSQQWAKTAFQEEQGVSLSLLQYVNIEAASYRFYLFADEVSLQSVLQEAVEDWVGTKAFVTMLSGWWKAVI
jgi:hypothetical protein